MILRLVLFLGVSGVLNSGQTPYRCSDAFYSRPDQGQRSWSDAQNVCRQSNAMLPMVSDQQSQTCFASALVSLNVNTRSESIWIGAKTSDADPSIWRWVNGDQYNLSPIPSGSLQETFAYITNISMRDSSAQTAILPSTPTALRSYICRYTGFNSDRCYNELKGFYYIDQCFVKNESKVSWFSARNSCLQNKGDLAFFDDIYLFDELIYHEYWIGLRRSGSAWTWNNAVNGTTMDVTYTLWSSGQPNGTGSQCISTDTPGDGSNSWKDSNCNDYASFICQGFSVPPSPSTGVSVSGVPTSTPSTRISVAGVTTFTPSTGFSVAGVTTSTPSPGVSVGGGSTSTPSPGVSVGGGSTSTPSTGFSVGGVTISSSSSTTVFPVDQVPNSSSSPETDNGAAESKDGSVDRSLLLALGVGIGVGLGVPFLIGLIALIVVIVICCRRRQKSGTKPKPDKNKENKEDVEMNSSSSLPNEESFGTVNKVNDEQLPPYTPVVEEVTEFHSSSHSAPPPHSDNHEESNDQLPPYNHVEEDAGFDAPLDSETLSPVPHEESYQNFNEGGHDQQPHFYPSEEDAEMDPTSSSVHEETTDDHYGFVEQLDPPSPTGDLSNLPPFPDETAEEHYGIVDNENYEQDPDQFNPNEPADSTVNYVEFGFNNT